MDHDVIVIGAGPSGSSFARIAAGAGMDVLVVDKRKDIGVPVRCGEGLGEGEVIREGLELPKGCCGAEIEGAKVIAPNGKEVTWKTQGTKGWVLDRRFFDKWLCELAVDKGAKVHTYTRAIEVLKDEKGRPNGLRLSHGGREPYDVHAPLIVSAEGMESLMARQMGFKTVHQLYDVYSCYQYEMRPYDHENMIELYFGKARAPGGYVWIFPKGDRRANVGIAINGQETNGIKCGMKGADPKMLLEDFIDDHLKGLSSLEDFGGVISIGAPIDEFVKDNCMVIGTAAKQVDPTHGGGIDLAMQSGVMAAETVVNAFEKKDYSKEMLLPYEKKWRKDPGGTLKKRLMARKVIEKLSDDDFNHILNSITHQDLANIMDGNFAPAVTKIIAGRPQLIGVLRALMP